MQQEIELKRREDDEKVMKMDLTSMSEQRKVFYKTLQDEIIARRCGAGNQRHRVLFVFCVCTMDYVYLNYISVCLLSKELCKHNLWLDYGPLCVVIVKLCAQMIDEID